jgi:hypothetical protein
MKSVDRCYTLDETLSKLARTHPDTKFLRSRAAALGFASTPSSSSTSNQLRTISGTITARSHVDEDDEDDPYADEKYDEFGERFVPTLASSIHVTTNSFHI